MADRVYREERAWQDVGGDVAVYVKLKDLGDGTHAPSVHDIAANEKLTALATKVDALQTALNTANTTLAAILTKLQASLNVHIV